RDGRYHFIAAPRRELYDTQNDPGETHNLAEEQAVRAEAQDRALRELVARTSATRPPASARAVDPDVDERLRALGYVGGSISSPTSGCSASSSIGPKRCLRAPWPPAWSDRRSSPSSASATSSSNATMTPSGACARRLRSRQTSPPRITTSDSSTRRASSPRRP